MLSFHVSLIDIYNLLSFRVITSSTESSTSSISTTFWAFTWSPLQHDLQRPRYLQLFELSRDHLINMIFNVLDIYDFLSFYVITLKISRESSRVGFLVPHRSQSDHRAPCYGVILHPTTLYRAPHKFRKNNFLWFKLMNFLECPFLLVLSKSGVFLSNLACCLNMW